LEKKLAARERELSEAIEQQAATSEVLRLVASSPRELDLVLRAILEKATKICEANFGHLFRFADDAYHLAAEIGTPPALAEFYKRRGSFQPTPGLQLDRVARRGRCARLWTTLLNLFPVRPAGLQGRDPSSPCHC